MDNATNYELNLDKPSEEWVFRVRLTSDEVRLIHKTCETPHEAYLNNPEMMDQIKVLGFRFTKLVQTLDRADKIADNLGNSRGATVMSDLTYRELWAIGGLVQNLAAELRMSGDVDHLAEHIYFFVQHITAYGINDAF